MIEGKPRVTTKSGHSEEYDLLVGALGVNSSRLKALRALWKRIRAPGHH